jgi:hypothetical protein
VRYRDLSDILRRNLLNQAARSTSNKSWQTDLERWRATKAHLEDCFAVTDKGIVGEKLRHLELFRMVESDRIEFEKSKQYLNKERDISEKDFCERWASLLKDYADRPDNGIFLESVSFCPKKDKRVNVNQVDNLIDSFLTDSPKPKVEASETVNETE